MPEKDPIESVLKISRVMSSLRAMTDPKGVSQSSQSVTKDDDRVSDKLTPTEQNRLKESAAIIGKVLQIGAFETGPEARRLKDITPTTQPSKVIPSAVRDKITPTKTEGTSWWDTLKKVAGAAGLAGLLWYLLPKDWKDKINKWWNDALSAFLGDENKQKLDKWWNDAIKPLLGDEKTKGEISKWWDSIYNKIMDKDGKQKDRFLSVWDKIFNLDENTELTLGQKFASILGKVIQFSIDTVARSYEVGGLASDVLISQKLAKPVIAGASKIGSAVSRADAMTASVKRAAEATESKITSGVYKTGPQAGKTWYKQGNKFISKADIPESVLKSLETPGMVSRGAAIAEKLKISKNAFSKLLSTGSGAWKAIKWIAKFPLLAEFFEAGSSYLYKREQEELFNNKKISAEEYNKRIGKKVADSLGGVLGARLGMLALGAAGSLLGPPGVFLGSVIGTAAGDWFGRWLVGNIINEKTSKSIGSYFTGVNQPSDEMQDFLVKNGNVYKFSSRDEVLGMKTGGAIDNLMTNLTQNLAKDNNVIRDASVAQVNKLDELIYLMKEFIKKPMQGSTSITNVSDMMSRSNFKSFDFREQFSNQTLIPVTTQPI